MLNHLTETASAGLARRTPAQDQVASMHSANSDEIIELLLRGYFKPLSPKKNYVRTSIRGAE
jgi:hypothetical protein